MYEKRRAIHRKTINQYVHLDSGQSQELAPYLPERQKKRKPRYARKALPSNERAKVAEY